MTEKINAIKHREKRANIPTNELRGFVAEDESAPKAMLYPRDPSLDPQLVWKGKDEQDRQPLAVPVVPIYIQEKIQPQAIIEAVRGEATRETPPQADLFADFNGIGFQDLIEFYRHEQNWSNRMILGDSLLVMTSLAEKEGLKGKVQTIYIDPPYGIKFGSNWQVSTRKREVKDGKAEDASREPEVIKAFRDTWALGIHSYLTYLRDRFVVARDLLSESGSIFVQIGDENVHVVRSVMDEVFGGENFVSLITIAKTTGATSEFLAGTTDYCLFFARSKDHLKYRQLFLPKELGGVGATQYTYTEDEQGQRRALTHEERKNSELAERTGRVHRIDTMTSQRPPGDFPINIFGKKIRPSRGYWKTGELGSMRLGKSNRLDLKGKTLCYVRYIEDFPVFPINNLWSDTVVSGFASDKTYVVETSPRIIERCILMTTDPGDLVLDPTCGSGTTAYVAEQWGRRWITIDTSRVALALARTRLMTARYPYYLLADSPEGLKKEAEITGRTPPDHNTDSDIRKGFVCKRVPHITLKSIANNPEIDEIHARWQEKLEPLRACLNQVLGTSWEEWEIPRTAETPWDTSTADIFHALKREQAKGAVADQGVIGKWLAAINHNLKRSLTLESLPDRPADPWEDEPARLHAEWWDLRRQRQADIDASIAKNADTELLYDQPYADGKRIRVAGPFTVESLSPHRVLAADADRDGTVTEDEAREHGELITTLIDHLRKAGIQNTKKAERLKFDRLETFAGEYIHAEGDYTDAGGAVKRVAICFGPENGTVGPELIREAAKEAVRGVGFDALYICGFAFDPHCAEEAKRYPKPVVQIAKMNPDLAMGDELLKKTGAGNLFIVFGEPDLEIRREAGKVVVEIKGVDIYDPTTGQIRSNSTDDIACWFIDTDYNEESFFVRHAYFTGADRPYEKLQKTLRAEIDEDAWASIYSTSSRPFDTPKTGKIAVKVINHYGDEILKVYDIR